MRYVRTTLRTVLVIFVLGLLHYVLPQHDVARVTSTEVIRMDFSSFNRLFFAQSDSGSEELETRDLRLINTQRKKSFLLGFIRRGRSSMSNARAIRKSRWATSSVPTKALTKQ